ncbi:Hpt domain protein [Synechococcus sp. PCC 7335]|uniref:Hpt domain-containing protein n=1 Tax=Synechococcus sp. (strain ATCC 29403 / PCC 7335) TaxID=91464 RepID=UPI00017EB4C0|nr:Hpt domain-containing protein [Synechococcus sp. PCC 7335]EDX85722.1 Hpt domain protein [Synechococcus sp. PCC 7335]
MSINTQNVPTLDTQALESISSDSSFLIEVCDSFLKEAPQRIAAIEGAFAKEDSAELSKTAHDLKSISSCVRATGLFKIAEVIEVIGKDNCTRPSLSLVEQVSAEYQTVHLAIQAYKEAH